MPTAAKTAIIGPDFFIGTMTLFKNYQSGYGFRLRAVTFFSSATFPPDASFASHGLPPLEENPLQTK
jgi:hypothetical protein